MTQAITDVAIVGGGIVGLASAYQLHLLRPELRILLLEKEKQVGSHQSGRNSGVIHSGIYYQPGSLKARTCIEGKKLLESFCTENQIAWDRCGKVVVAVDDSELPSLERIYERGIANGASCRKIDVKELREIEPHASGVAALHVPETGIVDYPAVCRVLADKLIQAGHVIQLESQVARVSFQTGMHTISTRRGPVQSKYLLNCAGLQCDRVMKMCGANPPARIVPFRGEYYELTSESQSLCRNLIYPVPNPNFPFLGVHFTRMIHGGVECGPNAVLAMAREGYDWKTLRVGDLLESLTYGGFLRLATRYWRTGIGEVVRSLSKAAFVKALQRLIPEIRADQLRVAPAGVRAQAIAPDGSMVDDFLFVDQEQAVHVCNAPSPAATASLKIGEIIAQRLLAQIRS